MRQLQAVRPGTEEDVVNDLRREEQDGQWHEHLDLTEDERLALIASGDLLGDEPDDDTDEMVVTFDATDAGDSAQAE